MTKTVLLIAMPTQGEIATETVRALIGLTQDLRRRGLAFAFETYEFSDIVFSRNQLLSIFLTRTAFSHMLMLDSDMIFEPSVVHRLLDFGAAFTATAYAQKRVRWAVLRQLIEEEAVKPEAERASTETLRRRAITYNHQIADFGARPWTAKRKGGFVTVPATGTGMILIDRSVPERMVEVGAAVPKGRMGQLPLHKGLNYHDFFSHSSSHDGGLMYGEDQSFCRRWVENCGGEIWLDTESEVGHVGRAIFPARYADKVSDDFPEIEDLE